MRRYAPRVLLVRIATELGAEVVMTTARDRAVLRLSAQGYTRDKDKQQRAVYPPKPHAI